MIFNKSKFFRNIFWLAASTALSSGLNVIINILLARKLGVATFGQWSLILATTSWILVLRTAVGSELIRKAAQDSQYAKLVFCPALLVLILGGSLLGGSNLLLNLVLVATNSILVPVMLATLAFGAMAVAIIPIALFTGRDHMEWQLADGIQGLLLLIYLLVLSRRGLTIASVAEAYLITCLVIAMLLMLMGMRLIRPALWRWTKAFMQELLINTGLQFVINWLYMLHLTLDLFFLQFLRGSVEVGEYNAAFKIVIVLRVLPLLVLMGVVPEISRRVAASDFAFVRRIWTASTRILLLIAGGFVVSILVLASSIIPLAYTSQYDRAINVLMVLSISIFPLFLQSIIQSLLYAGGRYRDLIWGIGIGLLVQATGDLFLISHFGPEGAALAFFMAECATLVCFAKFAVRAFGGPSVSVIGKALICSLAAFGMTLVGLRVHLPAALLLGSVIIFYLVLSYYLGCISMRDIQFGRSMLEEFFLDKV